MIIAQLVEVLWTKASRGAPAAAERNRLPQALPLTPGSEGQVYLFRHHRFDEKDGFAGVQLDGREAAQPPRREQELLLELHSDGTLILGLRHTLATGKPPRHERPQLLSAVLGEHAQLVVNGRHTSYSGQWYRRAT